MCSSVYFEALLIKSFLTLFMTALTWRAAD